MVEIQGRHFLSILDNLAPSEIFQISVDDGESLELFRIESFDVNYIKLRSSDLNKRVSRQRAKQFTFLLPDALLESTSDLARLLRSRVEIQKLVERLALVGLNVPDDSDINEVSALIPFCSNQMPNEKDRKHGYRSAKKFRLYGGMTRSFDLWLGQRRSLVDDIVVNGAFFARHAGSTDRALWFTDIVEEADGLGYFSIPIRFIVQVERAAALMDKYDKSQNTDLLSRADVLLRRAYGIALNYSDSIHSPTGESASDYQSNCWKRLKSYSR